MTTLEIILIFYLCASQILTMLTVNTSPTTYRILKHVVLFIFNPLGVIAVLLLGEKEEKTK